MRSTRITRNDSNKGVHFVLLRVVSRDRVCFVFQHC